MAVKKGFAVTVEGTYVVDNFVGRNRIAEKKNYKVTVNLPKYGEDALSIIKNRLLESAIRKFDPNYKTYLTHSITGVQPLGDTPDVALSGRQLTVNNMSVNQLVKFIQGQKLPVAIHLYEGDILELRKAIESCKANQKKFLAKQRVLQKDYEEQKELQEMNPTLETKGEVKLCSTPSEAVSFEVAPENEAPVNLQTATPIGQAKPELTNEQIVAAAEAKADAEEVAESEVDPAEDEEFLTDGSESFNRESEAPYPDNIDEEVTEEVDEADVADILAANIKEPKGELVEDL